MTCPLTGARITRDPKSELTARPGRLAAAVAGILSIRNEPTGAPLIGAGGDPRSSQPSIFSQRRQRRLTTRCL
jgi:hypothetical protein